jgi:hypothetical protein
MKQLTAGTRVRNALDYSNGGEFTQCPVSQGAIVNVHYGCATVPFMIVIEHLLTPNQ